MPDDKHDDKKQKQYDLEPHDHEPEEAEPVSPPDAAEAAEAAEADLVEEEPEAVKALDVCPNCGSPLGGVDVVVCLRCGFDMKKLKVINIKTGETEVAAEPEPDSEPAEPISGPGVGDELLPLGLTVIGVALLAIGYLAGSGGLFAGDVEPGFGARLLGLVRMLVRLAMFSTAGLAALGVLAHLLETRIGNIKLATVRMTCIFAVSALLTYFNIANNALEWSVEAIFQAAAFVGLSAVFFRLDLKDAVTLLGITVFGVIGLLVVSQLVVWAAVPG